MIGFLVSPRGRGDPTPYDVEEFSYGNSSPLLDHPLWRLLSPRCSIGRCRTLTHRPRHTMRGIFAPLLAAYLLCRRTARHPGACQGLRGGSRGVPSLPGRRGTPGVALSAPGDLLGVW